MQGISQMLSLVGKQHGQEVLKYEFKNVGGEPRTAACWMKSVEYFQKFAVGEIYLARLQQRRRLGFSARIRWAVILRVRQVLESCHIFPKSYREGSVQ